MSTVSTCTIGSINPFTHERIELATRLTCYAKAPEEALRAVFERVIGEVSKERGSVICSESKARMWAFLSKERILVLKDLLIKNMCKEILSQFPDEAITSMLKEHQEQNIVSKNPHGAFLRSISEHSSSKVVMPIEERAELMHDEVQAAIIAGLERETFSPPLFM